MSNTLEPMLHKRQKNDSKNEGYEVG